MNSSCDKILNSMSNLCDLYEMYVWENDGTKLDVLIDNNILAFYLYNNEDILDEFIINFDIKKNEINLYRYMCIMVLIRLFGNVIMYRDENIIYNDKQKNNIRFIINDEEVMRIVLLILDRQHNEFINDKIDIVVDMRKKLKNWITFWEFSSILDDRINISKKMLRSKRV